MFAMQIHCIFKEAPKPFWDDKDLAMIGDIFDDFAMDMFKRTLPLAVRHRRDIPCGVCKRMQLASQIGG
jgi:hypothetical protein